jgi:hypothetical protein
MAQPLRNAGGENDVSVEDLELVGPQRRASGVADLWVPSTANRRVQRSAASGAALPSLTPLPRRRVEISTRSSENEMRDMFLLVGIVVAQFAVVVAAIV